MLLKQSRKIAFGGIISALSLLFMFLTGVFPFAEYALPAISGILLMVLVIEFNKKTALTAYVAVAILSLLIAPSKESALLFVFFFGYYPIAKNVIERIKNRIFEWGTKLLLFNLAIVLAYAVAIYVFGMTDLIAQLNGGLKYGIPLLLLLGNFVFIVFDVALSQLVALYMQKIRPRISKILH